LIVRWPGVAKAGTTCDAPVVLTDLVPTLLHAAGIDANKQVGPLDGANIADAIAGKALVERPLFWHFPNYTNQGGRPAGAIREGDWKLIEHFEDGSLELFNLANDPSETTNLAEQEAARVKQLLGKLQNWRKSVGARMPTPNPDFDASLHERLYVTQDSSKLIPQATAAATEPEWKEWRTSMNQATKGQKPRVTPPAGDIRLHAKDAQVHAKNMRYEPQPNKNVLGFWTIASDWADWQFEVAKPGRYEVEVQQGCGAGSGGAEVNVEVAGEVLTFIVQDTGHFQHMITRVIGEVELPAGKQTLAIKPQTKPGVAVMDIRRVVLRPVE
jgi:arylsulfatase A